MKMKDYLFSIVVVTLFSTVFACGHPLDTGYETSADQVNQTANKTDGPRCWNDEIKTWQTCKNQVAKKSPH